AGFIISRRPPTCPSFQWSSTGVAARFPSASRFFRPAICQERSPRFSRITARRWRGIQSDSGERDRSSGSSPLTERQLLAARSLRIGLRLVETDSWIEIADRARELPQ